MLSYPCYHSILNSLPSRLNESASFPNVYSTVSVPPVIGPMPPPIHFYSTFQFFSSLHPFDISSLNPFLLLPSIFIPFLILAPSSLFRKSCSFFSFFYSIICYSFSIVFIPSTLFPLIFLLLVSSFQHNLICYSSTILAPYSPILGP